jgi:hypothetical protein
VRADDRRHGTVAGYQAHRRAGQKVCAACLGAKSRYEKTRKFYGEKMVPAIGTRRRIQALKALGFSGAEIGDHLGITYQAVHGLETNGAEKVFASTARGVRDLYARLSVTTPIGIHQVRIRNHAAGLGYALPHQWHDIDDPAEQPDPGYRELTDQQRRLRSDLDPVVVDRILAGDTALMATASRPEREAVVARWTETGRSLNDLERATGIKPERYSRKEGAA